MNKILIVFLFFPAMLLSQVRDPYPTTQYKKEIDEFENRKLQIIYQESVDIDNLDFSSIFNRVHKNIYIKPQKLLPATDPNQILDFLVNDIENTKTLRFKTNQMIFANQDGSYQINFILQHNTMLERNSKSWDMDIKLATKARLMPFNMHQQKVVVRISGNPSIQFWQKDFYFDFKEIVQDQPKYFFNRLRLLKSLNQEDLKTLATIFNNNERIRVQVHGLEGDFIFYYLEPQITFYRYFFKYAKELQLY